MGRFIKNGTIPTGSYAIRLPVGSSTVGPDSPVDGQVRYNQSNGTVEMYLNSLWRKIAKVGSVTPDVQVIESNDGVLTTFTMTRVVSEAKSIMVFVGGVYQQPTLNYTVNGTTTITFTSPPPAPTGLSPNKIVIVYDLYSTDAV